MGLKFRIQEYVTTIEEEGNAAFHLLHAQHTMTVPYVYQVTDREAQRGGQRVTQETPGCAQDIRQDAPRTYRRHTKAADSRRQPGRQHQDTTMYHPMTKKYI